MYKDILLSIAGIEVFPVVSLLLFVIVFTSVVISVARMDGGRAHGLAIIPLDDGERGSRTESMR